MIVWGGLLVLFLFYEVYALATKEKKVPTLSRTIWRLTSWQVVVDFWIELLPGGYNVRFTFRPLRIVVFGFMVWATIHLSFGECAFGIC